MNLPNVITISRILLVPVAIWAMVTGRYSLAFAIFLAAGLSDAIDGYIARRWRLKTELGAYLDPMADKALLVSIYLVLAILQQIPIWLAIAVATRDILIVAAVILSRLLNRPLEMRPLFISKANTFAQIAFAGLVLGLLSLQTRHESLVIAGAAIVAGFTLVSGAIYLRDWMNHMNSAATDHQP